MSSVIYHCYCTGVTQTRVLHALTAGTERSVDGIRLTTGACTGCQTCRRELEALIQAVADGSLPLPVASRQDPSR